VCVVCVCVVCVCLCGVCVYVCVYVCVCVWCVCVIELDPMYHYLSAPTISMYKDIRISKKERYTNFESYRKYELCLHLHSLCNKAQLDV